METVESIETIENVENKKYRLQSRLESKTMWASILSGLVLIYNSIASELGYPLIENELVNCLVNLILGLYTTFGVVNNPNNKDKI